MTGICADETVTVTVTSYSGVEGPEVEGLLITPGLAVTPSLDTPNRFSLTHIPSGRYVIPSQCAEHVEEAAQMAKGAGIDWTRDKEAIVADPTVRELVPTLVNRCWGRCNPSTPQPPPWRVQCHTCGWVWEDEEDEGCDAKEAKQLALEHECEPEVTIAPSDGDTWYLPYEVKDDGTLPERARRG